MSDPNKSENAEGSKGAGGTDPTKAPNNPNNPPDDKKPDQQPADSPSDSKAPPDSPKGQPPKNAKDKDTTKDKGIAKDKDSTKKKAAPGGIKDPEAPREPTAPTEPGAPTEPTAPTEPGAETDGAKKKTPPTPFDQDPFGLHWVEKWQEQFDDLVDQNAARLLQPLKTASAAFQDEVKDVPKANDKAFDDTAVQERLGPQDIPLPTNFTEFFVFFEKTTYWSDVEKLAEITPQIVKVNCKRYNPLTKVVLLNEDLYLVDLDCDDLTVDFPTPFLEDAFDLKSQSLLCFISLKLNLIFKTTVHFLVYLMHRGQRIEAIGRRRILRLLPKITDFRKHYRNDLQAYLKCNHHSVFTYFFRQLERTFPDKLLRDEMLEYWRYDAALPLWRKKYLKPGYLAAKILELRQEWKRRRVLQQSLMKGAKAPPQLDASQMLENLEEATSMDKHLAQAADVDLAKFTALDGNLDEILQGPDNLVMDTDLDLKDITDSITADLMGGAPKPVFNYRLEEIAAQSPALAEFMKFSEEIEEMELGILDINSNVYELTFREENAHGELTLIDLNASKTPHHYPFGPRTLTNFFDTLGSNTYRLFFLDDATRTVMEVTKDFVLAYLHGFDFETDMDKIDELNDLARELAAIREEHALPLVPILRIQMAFVGLLMNHTHDFEYHDAVLKEIVGIWQYNAESEEYEQVYPEQDTDKEEDAGEDKDKENPNDGQKDSEKEDEADNKKETDKGKDTAGDTSGTEAQDGVASGGKAGGAAGPNQPSGDGQNNAGGVP